jgi:hypothetical protein
MLQDGNEIENGTVDTTTTTISTKEKKSPAARCRWHFPVDGVLVCQLLKEYKKSYDKRNYYLTEAAQEELKISMDNPTELYYRLDPGNKRLFVNDVDVFHQFVSSMSTYNHDYLGDRDLITELWNMEDKKIKSYVGEMNEGNDKRCNSDCRGLHY